MMGRRRRAETLSGDRVAQRALEVGLSWGAPGGV